MSEIKTKISTYNDVVDLFGEEKAADMLSEALTGRQSIRKTIRRISWSARRYSSIRI